MVQLLSLSNEILTLVTQSLCPHCEGSCEDITSHHESQAALSRLSRTCKALRNISLPILYHVAVAPDRKFIRLACNITQRPDFANGIKWLKIPGARQAYSIRGWDEFSDGAILSDHQAAMIKQERNLAIWEKMDSSPLEGYNIKTLLRNTFPRPFWPAPTIIRDLLGSHTTLDSFSYNSRAVELMMDGEVSPLQIVQLLNSHRRTLKYLCLGFLGGSWYIRQTKSGAIRSLAEFEALETLRVDGAVLDDDLPEDEEDSLFTKLLPSSIKEFTLFDPSPLDNFCRSMENLSEIGRYEFHKLEWVHVAIGNGLVDLDPDELQTAEENFAMAEIEFTHSTFRRRRGEGHTVNILRPPIEEDE
ncbi:hypothetical protein PT974_12065 [Cladobotryum mycophilum]|uniref:F-box domain-containing protein n=1 Tax=Cladobotryum mycophilum TaxID=491253 RepID=A0ABR0S6Y5_9HYPO